MSLSTRLVSKRISSPSEAAAVLGTYEVRGGSKITPVILLPDRNPCAFWVSIPEGFYSIITRQERYVGIWTAGFHTWTPLDKISHMVTQQYIIYDTPVKECPTSDNVMVEVDVSVVLHIKEYEEDVKNFVYRLGPEKLESMLHAFQQESVRTMARNKKYSSIYDLMDTEELELPQQVARMKEAEAEAGAEPTVGDLAAEPIMMPGSSGGALEMVPMGQASKAEVKAAHQQLENTKRIMNEKLSAYGVKVYSITITNVLLPTEFRNQMEEATTFDSKNIRAAAEQKFRLLVIDDTEKRAQAEQALLEILEEAKAKNTQRVANELKVTRLFEAGTKALLADVQEKQNSDVREISAESRLKVAELDRDKQIELAGIKAGADAEVAKIKTELEAFVMKTKAEAQIEVAKNNAEALRLQSEAERTAATQLRSKRDFEAKMSQLRVLKNLALNNQVAISGTNNDNIVAQLLSAKNSTVALGLNA